MRDVRRVEKESKESPCASKKEGKLTLARLASKIKHNNRFNIWDGTVRRLKNQKFEPIQDIMVKVWWLI